MTKGFIIKLGIFLFAAIVIAIALLVILSRKGGAPGLVDKRLAPCSEKPNCVCSEHESDQHFIKPLDFDADGGVAWAAVKRAIAELGGTVQAVKQDYLSATFATKVLRFVDDLELRMDSEGKRIHVRSASRVGYSDMGENRKRIELLRAAFIRQLEGGG